MNHCLKLLVGVLAPENLVVANLRVLFLGAMAPSAIFV